MTDSLASPVSSSLNVNSVALEELHGNISMLFEMSKYCLYGNMLSFAAGVASVALRVFGHRFVNPRTSNSLIIISASFFTLTTAGATYGNFMILFNVTKYLQAIRNNKKDSPNSSPAGTPSKPSST